VAPRNITDCEHFWKTIVITQDSSIKEMCVEVVKTLGPARDGAFEFCSKATGMVDRLRVALSHLHVPQHASPGYPKRLIQVSQYITQAIPEACKVSRRSSRAGRQNLQGGLSFTQSSFLLGIFL
jgi:hypothetical protein